MWQFAAAPFLAVCSTELLRSERGGTPAGSSLEANRLLAHLQADARERLKGSLELVRLEKGRILADVGDAVKSVYFPVSGLISLLSLTSSGEGVEIAMFGRDGFVGVPLALRVNEYPYRLMVQLAGDAYRMRTDTFLNELRRHGAFEDAVFQHAYSVLAEAARSAVCNRFHTVTQRLSRWLLISQDHLGSPTIDLTQEFIALMLGVPRNTVSSSAIVLQDRHFIEQRHGRIRIINREGLKRAACECYQIVRRETRAHSHVLTSSAAHDRRQTRIAKE